MEAGPAQGSVLDQGYTFVTKSVFANANDMEYYINECPGHLEYKEFLKAKCVLEGLMSVYFTPGISFTI